MKWDVIRNQGKQSRANQAFESWLTYSKDCKYLYKKALTNGANNNRNTSLGQASVFPSKAEEPREDESLR